MRTDESPPVPIHFERHDDGAVSVLVRIGRRTVALDFGETGPVLTRVFQRVLRAWPKTAESELFASDDEDLFDVIGDEQLPLLFNDDESGIHLIPAAVRALPPPSDDDCDAGFGSSSRRAA